MNISGDSVEKKLALPLSSGNALFPSNKKSHVSISGMSIGGWRDSVAMMEVV